ncbi:HEAT repeat domain-containing protein [Bacillus alkalicellulosilyticus]|uniref:HEAT repeat domain-containing protein n=1 Tax=Alkalihalobacterium alkalicellulosilyticum TaxID=1912214 RepID=UPI001FE98B9E|nr:HEAT repeat domain-containing protein [Bacillus alkalicellulosilyticus]
MSSNESKQALPDNFETLKKSINRSSNWRERLDAVEELGEWKTRETIELLKHSLKGDPVTTIREAAYRKLQALGEKVSQPEPIQGDLIKDTKKVLVRIKKSLPADHSYHDFKEKVKKMRIDLYDTYEGEKGVEFDKWLENLWVTLRT